VSTLLWKEKKTEWKLVIISAPGQLHYGNYKIKKNIAECLRRNLMPGKPFPTLKQLKAAEFLQFQVSPASDASEFVHSSRLDYLNLPI
jgi:hypothetical protein